MAAVASKKGYVEAADLVRAATIVGVVAVHSTWYMANGGHWVSSGAALALMHFTRESFMALTGFVLTYSLFGKNNKWGQVWTKRYKLVLFPYLIWSAAYILLLKGGFNEGFLTFLGTYGRDLLDGGAWFQLYYLLITMQFYLILPLFLALMKVAKKYPIWVVASATVFQMALMGYDQYAHAGGFISQHVGDEFWTYTGYFVLGGVGALYWPQVREWLATHMRTVLWWSLATALLMLGEFFAQTYIGHNMTMADSVIQPAMVPWAMMCIILLAAIGVRYEKARMVNPKHWQLVKFIADVSFGIYLVHPMLLQYWTDLLAKFGLYHFSFLLDAFTVVLLVAASGALMILIGKTPFSPWLIGRAARRRPAPAVQPEPVAVDTRVQQM